MKNLKILSYVLIVLSFAMVTLGGVVHNTGSSLACPDWPLCFGQVFPKMEGAVAVEHSHRLLGTLIGFLVIVLNVLTFTHARSLFKFSLLALGVVIFQGVLGGVTVLLKLSPVVSTSHLATSQLFLATLLYYTYRLHRLVDARKTPTEDLSRVAYNGVRLTLVAVFVQMCLGAFIRHGGASVACGLGPNSLWTCVDNLQMQNTLWPSTGPAQMHMLHRFLGVAVAFLVIFCTLPVLRYAKRNGNLALRRLVVLAHITVSVQVLLGFLTVYSMIQTVVVTFHLIFGMILWMNIWLQFLLSKENVGQCLQTPPLKPKEVVLTT